MVVYIASGTGSGQLRTISDYVGSTRVATVTTWTTTPTETSVYEVGALAITGTTTLVTSESDATITLDKAGTFFREMLICLRKGHPGM